MVDNSDSTIYKIHQYKDILCINDKIVQESKLRWLCIMAMYIHGFELVTGISKWWRKHKIYKRIDTIVEKETKMKEIL